MDLLRQQRSLAAICSCLVVLGIVGCSKAPQESPARDQSNRTEPTQQAWPEPADRSLDSAAYIRLGMPAYDREWSADDMKRAFEALNALADKDPRQLPRYRSSRSGAYFSRITDEHNLRFLRNHSLPIGTRMSETTDFFWSINKIVMLYLDAFLNNATGGAEFIELLGARLRLAVLMIEQLEEFMPTLNKRDPTYQGRMEALTRLRGHFEKMVAGSLLVLTEKRYRMEDRARLLGYQAETFPAIVAQLSPGSRAEALTRLEKLAADPSIRELHPALRRLLGRLRGATKKE